MYPKNKYLILVILLALYRDSIGFNVNVNDTIKVKFMMIDFKVKIAFSTDTNYKMMIENGKFKIDDLNEPDFEDREGYRKFKFNSDSTLSLFVFNSRGDSLESTIKRQKHTNSTGSNMPSLMFSSCDDFESSHALGTMLSDTIINRKAYHRVLIINWDMEGKYQEEVYIDKISLMPSQIILNAYEMSGRKLRDAYFYIEQ